MLGSEPDMLKYIFRKFFFPPRVATLQFTPDLAGNDRDHLKQEMEACLNRDGGSVRNLKRVEALTELFLQLSPVGQQVYVEVLTGLEDTPTQTSGDTYSKFEEAEMFGGSASKLAVLDVFEPRRRRFISMLRASERGPEALVTIESIGPEDLKKDIEFSF